MKESKELHEKKKEAHLAYHNEKILGKRDVNKAYHYHELEVEEEDHLEILHAKKKKMKYLKKAVHHRRKLWEI